MPKTKTTECCGNCYFSRLMPNRALVCKEGPMQAVTQIEDKNGKLTYSIITVRPNVDTNDWCGRWRFSAEKKVLPMPKESGGSR